MILGHEMVGEVIDVGEDVTLFKKGDRSVCNLKPTAISALTVTMVTITFAVTKGYWEQALDPVFLLNM